MRVNVFGMWDELWSWTIQKKHPDHYLLPCCSPCTGWWPCLASSCDSRCMATVLAICKKIIIIIITIIFIIFPNLALVRFANDIFRHHHQHQNHLHNHHHKDNFHVWHWVAIVGARQCCRPSASKTSSSVGLDHQHHHHVHYPQQLNIWSGVSFIYDKHDHHRWDRKPQ